MVFFQDLNPIQEKKFPKWLIGTKLTWDIHESYVSSYGMFQAMKFCWKFNMRSSWELTFEPSYLVNFMCVFSCPSTVITAFSLCFIFHRITTTFLSIFFVFLPVFSYCCILQETNSKLFLFEHNAKGAILYWKGDRANEMQNTIPQRPQTDIPFVS